jgi:GNAT superfamily N-acetyltransferase
VRIRSIQPEEAALLSAIAHESKAHRGYTAQQLALWRDQLTITAAQVAACDTFAADVTGELAGFYMLCQQGDRHVLEHLWIRPRRMGRGIGAALLHHALQVARHHHAAAVTVVSDPHAAGFYKRQGGVRVGAVAAPLPDAPERELPVYEFVLKTPASSGV